VEFGAEDGRENNGRYLLLKGWQGFWLESDPAQVALLGKRFRRSLDRGALLVTQAVVTRENVEALLTEMGVPVELDLLSIDIDGNDYWVWKAMSQFRPRVVVIEYNAALGPRATWVMPYDADHAWDGRSSRFGASLKALERLGTKKGYDLVGCSFTGVNAFFVRSDLIGGRFTGPFTAERHYEPARYFPVSWAYSPDWGNNEDWAANGSEAGLGDTQARPSE
jgi:hypothetical protein